MVVDVRRAAGAGPDVHIDNGVGQVTNGQTTSVTINTVTTFTITCTNSAGTGMRQVVVSVPPVAPNISTFTAMPNAVTIGQPTDVTWTWTYVGTPSPAPMCSISPQVGPVTNGQTTTSR